jgi:hypothetical protein
MPQFSWISLAELFAAPDRQNPASALIRGRGGPRSGMLRTEGSRLCSQKLSNSVGPKKIGCRWTTPLDTLGHRELGRRGQRVDH